MTTAKTNSVFVDHLIKIAEQPLSAILVPALIVYAVITGDWWPLAVAGAWFLIGYIFVGYIFVGASVPAYTKIRDFIEQLTGKLDPWLLAVSSAGAVAVAVFAFDWNSVRASWPTQNPWTNWHRGATAWALLLCIYQIRKLDLVLFPRSFVLIWGTAILVAVVWMWPDNKESIGEYIIVTAGAGVFSFVLDFVLTYSLYKKLKEYVAIDDPESENKSCIELRRASQCLWLSDVPVILACLIIWLYTRVTQLPEQFVAGVLSFQLLTSKAIFLFIEADAGNPTEPVPGGLST